MDNAASGNTEPRRRPQRERHLPAYLDDYQVGFQPPAHMDLPTAVSRSSSHHSSNHSRSSNRSSYMHSRSSRRTCYSVGTYPNQGLSTAQAAILEERIKQLELEDMRRMIEHETQADFECKMLDDQAKEAQRLQEEALKAREALTKRLEREKRLTRAEQDLEIAKLRSSMLSSSWTSAHSSSHSDKSVPFLGLPTPMQVQQVDVLPATSQLRSTQSLPTLAPVVQPPIPSPQVMHQVTPVPFSMALPVGTQQPPQPVATPARPTPTANPTAQPQSPVPMASMSVKLQPGPVVTPAPAPQPVPHPAMHVITSAPLAHPAPQVASSFESKRPGGPAPVTSAHSNQQFPAYPVESQFSTMYQPAYNYSQPTMELLNTAQHASYGALPPSSTHHGKLPAPVLSAPYPGYTPLPGAELLIASALGIPRPSLPVFESGRESDFALLKLALDSVLGSNLNLSEQYKYQVLIGHIKLPSALQLAKAYMHDPAPYTSALQALQDKYGQPRQLVQSELGAILNTPALKIGDANAFDSFALSVQSLVGMLKTLEGQNGWVILTKNRFKRVHT